jgi:hypothetical protein
MGHLIFLIFQLLCIVFYALCKAFGWPGVYTMLLLSWFLPIVFYLVMSLRSMFKKQNGKALLYVLFSALLIAIPVKIMFTYYNVILHAVLIALFLFVFYRVGKNVLNRSFKIFAVLVSLINVALLFTPDGATITYLGANYGAKDYDGKPLTWDQFQKADSIEGGYSAHIVSTIASRISRVRNYTPATVIAKMNTEKSLYILKNDGLLEHELYHFKITELTACKLRKALENYHFASHEEIRIIVDQYMDTLYDQQNAYDTQTKHNLNASEQRRWKLKTDEALKNY